jgi:hypothetical protein
MNKVILFAGLLSLAGAASIYGCSESSGNHPPVLGSGSSGGNGGSGGGGSGSGSGGSSGGTAGSSSGSASGSSSGSGGGSGSSSGGSSGGDGGCATDDACNTLQLCGAQVPVNPATGSFPIPAGGTVVPGTYVLTAVDDYSGGTTDGGSADGGMGWQRQTIQLATSTADGGPLPDAGSFSQNLAYDAVKDSDSAPAQTLEGVFSTAGKGYSIDYSCPSGAQVENGGYTATSTTLAIMAQPLVFTYAKQ